ncbi:homoserine kinase [Thermosinus carboxydivorans Nor1]|uniref:Homoserine kinase n=1 Tax=Thermosinus carboxydivorans Nor1 TaxID=401526 RepID=A1HTU8_9FIRM|nr:homoserine kinase [Thermosinus carboxydivorans]EAX46525.1 homoserine kinase [Thermosinus carboxydivorans Nor1]
MAQSVKVRVPGTIANCGPGFDAVGMAGTIYNYLELTLTEQPGVYIEVKGEGSGTIPDNEHNIAYQAVQAVFRKVGAEPCGVILRMENSIPLARGLGSSAAAIVAGLTAANALTGSNLSSEELLEMATQIEGHPDNVAPALFGGATISVAELGKVRCLRIDPAAIFTMVVAVPEFGLSTKAARQVLPKTVPHRDAVFNVGRAAMLVGALCTGNLAYLRYVLDDRLHQPYRQRLIPGMQRVFAAAVAQGALGAVISGAGPCLVAFTQHAPAAVGEAMVHAFAENGVKAHYLLLDLDRSGAQIIEEDNT